MLFTGYYRINYDIENWKRIASYLASENYMKIHVLNRAQIFNDAFHFMITKQLDSSIFWKITEYLVRETDYVAWYPMFKAMEYMSSVFPLPGEKANKIKVDISCCQFIYYVHNICKQHTLCHYLLY